MKKIRLIGVYDYTVVLTYISLVITLVGISLAIEGSFRSAVFCLALSGLCDMFDGKIARKSPVQRRTVQRMRRNLEFRSIPCVMWYVLVCFRQ